VGGLVTGAGFSETVTEETGGLEKSEKVNGTTFGIQVNDGQDAPDHTRDLYFILFGSHAQLVDRHDGHPNITIDPTTGRLDTLTVFELQGLAQDPQDLTRLPAEKAANLAPFIKPSDAAQLLAQDPFISGEPIAGSASRFVPATPPQLPLLGPDNPGDPLPTATAITETSTTKGQTTGDSSETELTTSLGVTFFGSEGSIEGTFEVDYERKSTTETSDQATAQITIATESLCTRGKVDMYMDTAFGVYLGIPHLFDQCQTLPMRTLSFESIADWILPRAVSAGLSDVSVTGAHSLSISAIGWTPLTSIPLASSLLRQAAKSSDLSKVSLAIQIPGSQPNPFWIGAVQMYLTSPSANVFNAYLGQVELTPLPQGQFVRLPFVIPSYALHALTEDHPDVSFTIVLNANNNTSGWLLDDLTIGK
jgi:hypothetical protein